MTLTEVKKKMRLKWFAPWDMLDDYSTQATILEEMGSLKCTPFKKAERY